MFNVRIKLVWVSDFKEEIAHKYGYINLTLVVAIAEVKRQRKTLLFLKNDAKNIIPRKEGIKKGKSDSGS